MALLPLHHPIQTRMAVTEVSYIRQKMELVKPNMAFLQLLVFFKSDKFVEKDSTCTKKCVGKSKCKTLPFSFLDYCQCPANFDGDLCDLRSSTSFSYDINSLLMEAITIPQLSDVFFKVKDIQEDVANGFGNIKSSLKSLGRTFQNAFHDFSGKIKRLFLKQSVRIKYESSLTDMQMAIDISSELFNPSKKDTRIGKYSEEQMINHAKDLIMSNKIKHWVKTLDNIFKGNNRVAILDSLPPLLELTMDTRRESACTEDYKQYIDLISKRFHVLQTEVYLMYAQASHALGRETSWIPEEYRKQVEDQVICVT